MKLLNNYLLTLGGLYMFEIQSKKIIFTLLFVSCFLFATIASSETIVCEGNLTDINGNPVNKTIKMSFSINSTRQIYH